MPLIISELLNDYIDQLNERLPNMLEDLDVHGSIALSAFESDLSDIDFISDY